MAVSKELTLRHLHSITRPNGCDRVEGWKVYEALFDTLISEAEKENAMNDAPLFLLPDLAEPYPVLAVM